MTPAQEGFLARVKARFSERIDPKFRKGCAEHDGDLFQMTRLERLYNTEDELLDAFTYNRAEIELEEKRLKETEK